jgi:phosphoribosylformylglycinamidine cyclo-ligase
VERGIYARAGVDAGRAGAAVRALVDVLASLDPGRERRALELPGHYAAVLRLDERLGLALCTDGVGSKVIVAERLGRFDTIGIDCVAMNANDLVCVGAEPLALLDYIAIEQAEPEVLREIGQGLVAGAEQAGLEIPGGELAQLPELIRGHPSPCGFDIVGACFGLVELDAIVTGKSIAPGDAILGLPSSGVHSNGLTLARSTLTELDERPAELGGRSVGEELLEPTVVYVRGVLELLRSSIDVRGLAHITGDGLMNLLRLNTGVGYLIDRPLPVPAVFGLIAARSGTEPAEMYEVFNMGCGFCCVVPEAEADAAVALLAARHPGTQAIGKVTDRSGLIELPAAGLAGGRDGFSAA